MNDDTTDSIDPPSIHDGRQRRSPLSRRKFLGAVGGMTAGAAAFGTGTDLSSGGAATPGSAYRDGIEPFYGSHQGGITTRSQSHTYFAALDVTTDRRHELAELLRSWTAIAANLTSGKEAAPMTIHPESVEPDSGETLGLGPARLTVNFGFGPSLFDGPDRFGLADDLPMQLVALPEFPGDELTGSNNGGDLTVQACADDPQVAFHAVRQLVRAGTGVASMRWSQAGFSEVPATDGTPRNLMGFKDGTSNPSTAAELAQTVWVGTEGPSWMKGGTYLVVRRIRIALADWDTQPLRSQEQIIGRHKVSGAPLGESGEFDALDLDAKDAQGHPVIPVDAHVRLTSSQENWGQTMLRRSYSYSNGVIEPSATGQQAPVFDAGLLFAAYQRSPRFVFIPIYQVLAANDALRHFTTHTASAIVAIPPAAPHMGHWVGQQLLEA